MKKFQIAMTVLFMVTLLFAGSAGVLAYDPNNPPAETPPLADLNGRWSEDIVMEMYSYGIIDGYPDGNFLPDNSVTRAEFAKLLCAALRVEQEETADSAFADVPQNHWAHGEIAALYDRGIIKGVSTATFSPDAYITRQDMMLMLRRADYTDLLHLTADPAKTVESFKDHEQITSYARKAMIFGVQCGILRGDDRGYLRSLSYLTRGECAQVLKNSMYGWSYEALPLRITQGDWTEWKKETELSNGLTMSYVEMGQATGEPLILVHGSTDTSRSWSLAAPYLAGEYHIYIPDVRNHGDTGSGAEENTMRRIENGVLGNDLICFMDAIGVERGNLVGHSRGSRIVQLAAMNYPERVSRCISVSGHVVVTNTPEAERDHTYYEDPFTSLPIDAEYMDWWYYNDIPVDEDFLAMAKYESAWLPLEAWRAIGGSLAEPQDYNDEIPLLLLFGAEDYLTAGAEREALFKENYGSVIDESVIYPGMGHNLQWEEPEMIADKIDSFIDSTVAAEIEAAEDYPVAADPGAPVKVTGLDPSDYYDASGNLTAQLDAIPQGDWKNFKHYVELESGIQMAYIEMGNPEGKPLVLLHGMTDSSRSWSLLVPYLSEYHLYIPDQRGHGDTDKPDMKKYDRSLFAYDLSCFMAEMGLAKADIMGHSMGSMNAQAFAMDYPEMVDHLILESTRCIGYNSEDPKDADNPYLLEAGEESPLTWEYMEWWYYNPVPVDAVFHFNAIMESWKLPLKCWASINAVPYQARNIDCKTLVLYGGLDYLMGGETQKEVISQFDEGDVDYTYVTFENRGHNIHWEESQLVAEDVIHFLNDERDLLKDHDLVPYSGS